MNLPLVNIQPIEKQMVGNGSVLDVQEIFPTIQGEGPFVGTPAIFVRLAGCDLQCPLCDTDYTSKRQMMPVGNIIGEVVSLSPREKSLIVITGGEPFRQPLGLLVGRLCVAGFQVQIETNGTLFDSTLYGYYNEITIVCSPKTPKLNPDLMTRISAYKYILSSEEVDWSDGLPTKSLGQGRPARPFSGFQGKVYVQPCDDKDVEKNRRNTKAAIKSCMEFGYTFCLQVHKLVNLP